MNVLIIGSGGREHTLAWKIKQSREAGEIFIAPGNAGTALIGTNLNIQLNDFELLKNAVIENNIGMVVVGPEDPLFNGICDYLKGIPLLKDVYLIGPGKAGAMLEGSKDFAKQFMVRNHIPTAAYKSFSFGEEARAFEFLEEIKPPYVLKADGLAAGKGVLILNDLAEAKKELSLMLSGKFGEASRKVVIEEFLDGIELSVFVITDGINYKILPEAKDYKRIGEGDTGLNTGGMGAISPVPFADKEFLLKIEENIIKPTIEGLKKDNIPYIGFIFFGLINVNNEPLVIEYNVRMGDPETEVVLPRIESDFLDLLTACAQKKLDKTELTVNPMFCSTVVLSSKGYPGSYEKGKIIGIGKNIENTLVFHAGTKSMGNDIVTNGGRVLAVSALGDTMKDALQKSYLMIENINFEGKTFRKDIGFDFSN